MLLESREDKDEIGAFGNAGVGNSENVAEFKFRKLNFFMLLFVWSREDWSLFSLFSFWIWLVEEVVWLNFEEVFEFKFFGCKFCFVERSLGETCF